MKRITYQITTALLVTLLAVISGCSSYEDPDIAFKGNIDENFLNGLSRGETSVKFDLSDYKVFEMDYASYHKGNGKWSTFNKSIGGLHPSLSSLIILDGKCWSVLNLVDAQTLQPSVLSQLWFNYCKETGCNNTVYVTCPFEFNAKDNYVVVGGHTFSVNGNSKSTKLNLGIEKAAADNMILSGLNTISVVDDNNNLVPDYVTKTILFYKKVVLEPLAVDECYKFDNITDALLGIIKLLREKYGDTPYFGNHYINGEAYPQIIDLVQVENNIRNGIEEYANNAIRIDTPD